MTLVSPHRDTELNYNEIPIRRSEGSWPSPDTSRLTSSLRNAVTKWLLLLMGVYSRHWTLLGSSLSREMSRLKWRHIGVIRWRISSLRVRAEIRCRACRCLWTASILCKVYLDSGPCLSRLLMVRLPGGWYIPRLTIHLNSTWRALLIYAAWRTHNISWIDDHPLPPSWLPDFGEISLGVSIRLHILRARWWSHLILSLLIRDSIHLWRPCLLWSAECGRSLGLSLLLQDSISIQIVKASISDVCLCMELLSVVSTKYNTISSVHQVLSFSLWLYNLLLLHFFLKALLPTILAYSIIIIL